MKFRTLHVDLQEKFGWTTNAGEGLWVDIPVGVTEGLVRQINELSGTNEDGTKKDPTGRLATLLTTDQITAWNLDDDKGRPLPLTKTKSKVDDKIEILAQIPIDLIPLLTETLISGKAMTEQAEDFSKTSSGPSLSIVSPSPS